MTDHPFRFGTVAGHALYTSPRSARPGHNEAADCVGSAPSYSGAWTGLARRAESLGYATLLVPDTLGTLSPFTAAAVAATATTSLRVGTYVLSVANRSPEAVAWETATLQTLTDGRFELGLGAGRPDAERDAATLGLRFGTPGQRIERLSRTIDAVKDVRVLVAAAGTKLLTLAARKADTIALGVPPQYTEDQLASKLDELYELAGDRFNELELGLNLACAGADPPEWALARFGRVGTGILTGTPQQMADTLRRRRDSLGVSYVSVNAQFLDAFAPVVELLAGT